MKKLFKTLIAVLFCLTIVVSLAPTAWAQSGVIHGVVQENDVGIYNSGLDFDQMPIESGITTDMHRAITGETVQIDIKPSAALPLLIDKTNPSNNTNFIPGTIDKNRRTISFNPVTITGHMGKLPI